MDLQSVFISAIDTAINKTRNGESREDIFKHLGLVAPKVDTAEKKPRIVRKKTAPVVPDPETPVEKVMASNAKSPQAPPIDRHTDAPLPSGVTTTTRVVKKQPPPVPSDPDQVDSIIASCDATKTTTKPTVTRGRVAGGATRRSKSAAPGATPTTTGSGDTATVIPLVDAVKMCKDATDESPVTRCMRKFIIGSLSGNVCGKPGVNLQSTTESHEVRCADCMKMKGGARTSIAKDIEGTKKTATKRVVKKEPVVKDPEPVEEESDHVGIPEIKGAPNLTNDKNDDEVSPSTPTEKTHEDSPPDDDAEIELDVTTIEKLRTEMSSDTPAASHNGNDLTLELRPLRGFANMYYTRTEANSMVAVVSIASHDDEETELQIEGVVKGSDINNMVINAYMSGKTGALERFEKNIIRLDTDDLSDDVFDIAYDLASKSDILSYKSKDGSNKELQAETPNQ
jgi:hypothetical protein